MSRSVFTDVAEFETRLSLPPGFYAHLLQEDDWSFVIKLNALFEGAATRALCDRLGTPKLEDSLARLDFAHPQYGKLKLLRELGLLTSDQAKILKSLAELRNDVVHNIANVSFSFSAHLSTLDKHQLASISKLYGHGVVESVPFGGHHIPKAEFVRFNPKLSLWLTCAEVLACLELGIKSAKLLFVARG